MITTPVILVRVVPVGPTSWLQTSQYRLYVKHEIRVFTRVVFSWNETYLAGEEALPGAWEWYRASDKKYMTRMWLLDSLDAILQKAIRDRLVTRAHFYRGVS